jgi:hypothetical protein
MALRGDIREGIASKLNRRVAPQYKTYNADPAGTKEVRLYLDQYMAFTVKHISKELRI